MKSTRGREAVWYCSEPSTILKLRTEEGVGVVASDVSVAPEFYFPSQIYQPGDIQHCNACITFNVASVFSLNVIYISSKTFNFCNINKVYIFIFLHSIIVVYSRVLRG